MNAMILVNRAKWISTKGYWVLEGNIHDKKSITLSVSVDIRYKIRALSAMLDRKKSEIVSDTYRSH